MGGIVISRHSHEDPFPCDSFLLQDLLEYVLTLPKAWLITGVQYEHHPMDLSVVALPDGTDLLPTAQVENGDVKLLKFEVGAYESNSWSNVILWFWKEEDTFLGCDRFSCYFNVKSFTHWTGQGKHFAQICFCMHLLGYTKWEYWSLTFTKGVQCL